MYAVFQFTKGREPTVAYEAILRTGIRTKDFLLSWAAEENWTTLPESEYQRRINLGKAFNGLRAVITEEILGKEFALCYIHPEDREKAKEGYYIAEQAPYFGSYINNRQDFERDWAAGTYEPDYTIKLHRKEVQIIRKIGYILQENTEDLAEMTESEIAEAFGIPEKLLKRPQQHEKKQYDSFMKLMR